MPVICIGDEEAKRDFDYHTQSEYTTSPSGYQRFEPGPGYGGDDNPKAKFPLKNTSPDTTAVSEPIQHFAPDRNVGLAEDAILQVPPNSLY